jgi:alpha-glucosidase
VLDEYDGERAMVGEVNLRSPQQLAPYYGAGDQLHLVFNFSLLDAPWQASAWRDVVAASLAALGPVGAWPVWVLSNHDTPRHRTRFGGCEARARVAAVLLLALPGTPFLYAGEELGLEDAVVPPEAQVDPGGRDGCRAPIPWTREPGHGWPERAWLPFPPDAAARSVQAQRADPGSVLHLYRRLLAARRACAALQTGDLQWVQAPEGVLAWLRRSGGEVRLVVANFAATPARVLTPRAYAVEVSSDGAGEREPWSGAVGAEQALVLRPVDT